MHVDLVLQFCLISQGEGPDARNAKERGRDEGRYNGRGLREEDGKTPGDGGERIPVTSTTDTREATKGGEAGSSQTDNMVFI